MRPTLERDGLLLTYGYMSTERLLFHTMEGYLFCSVDHTQTVGCHAVGLSLLSMNRERERERELVVCDKISYSEGKYI